MSLGGEMAESLANIMLGRDRMKAVLEPLLGAELALERANNIAQVLVFAADDVSGVALGMLRSTGLTDPRAVADEVARAWQRGVEDSLRESSERAA